MTYIILKVEGDWIILREDQLLLVNYDKKYISLISGDFREYEQILSPSYEYSDVMRMILRVKRDDNDE